MKRWQGLALTCVVMVTAIILACCFPRLMGLFIGVGSGISFDIGTKVKV